MGEGSFGITYLANYNGQQVAAKAVKYSKHRPMEKQHEIFQREIATLQDISIDGCSKYISCYIGTINYPLAGIDTTFLLTEYIPGITLKELIGQKVNILPYNMWSLMLQLILGLKFIHDRSYAHRDIKPENIMVTPDYILKYIDFGLACMQKCDTCQDTCNRKSGSVVYMPPDYRIDQLSGLKYEQAHDVWSLSIVLLEMANGKLTGPTELGVDIDGYPIYEYPFNYKEDDGRTNKFLREIIVPNWKDRLSIGAILNKFLEQISSVPWTSIAK